MKQPESDQVLKSSIKSHMLVSVLIVGLLVGGIGIWAAVTEIAGAVVASGSVVVETNIKQVQHQEGGIVKSIHVTNGDEVIAGDLLLELDDTVTRANLAIITGQLDSLYAQKARLEAEQDGSEAIEFDRSLFSETDIDSLSVITDSQERLLDARRNSLNGQKQQFGEQIVQFERQIEGLEAQRIAKESEIKFVESELVNLDELLAQQLVSASRVSVLNREKVKIQGDIGGLIAQIAQTKEAISERSIQVLQLDEDFLASVLSELQTVRSEIAKLEEQKIAAEDQLKRIEIRAPLEGVVHNLNVHTIGGIITPGEVAMLIVPQGEQLVVEAQVQPINIDQVSALQTAIIRLPSFDQRTTPELKAQVKTISADLLTDQVTGLRYYSVRLVISEDELEKLGEKLLVPGMPVEAFITTQERTVLSYLVKPIADQIAHAMKER